MSNYRQAIKNVTEKIGNKAKKLTRMHELSEAGEKINKAKYDKNMVAHMKYEGKRQNIAEARKKGKDIGKITKVAKKAKRK